LFLYLRFLKFISPAKNK